MFHSSTISLFFKQSSTYQTIPIVVYLYGLKQSGSVFYWGSLWIFLIGLSI